MLAAPTQPQAPKNASPSVQRQGSERSEPTSTQTPSALASGEVIAWRTLSPRIWHAVPWIGLMAAAIATIIYGVPTGILVATGTALIAATGALWKSLQQLAGDRSLAVSDALAMASANTEDEQKLFLIRALKDLEFERSLGKIGDADYEELKQRYRAQAKQVLQELDRKVKPAREEAEKLINDYLRSQNLLGEEPDRRPMEQPTARPEQAAKESPASEGAVETSGKSSRSCAGCGTHNDSDARFCKSCGTSFQNESAVVQSGALNQ